jgi:hypothetical protein
MASSTHPRRDTPAANADILGDDASFDGKLEKAPATERPRATGEAREDTAGKGAGVRDRGTGEGEARAGEDINQPGFVRDPDAGKS